MCVEGLEDIPEASRNKSLKEPVKGLAVRKKLMYPRFSRAFKKEPRIFSPVSLLCTPREVWLAVHGFCRRQIKSGISFHRRALREEKPSADTF